MRIAICASKFMDWDGGIDFIYTIYLGLKGIKEKGRLEIFLFIPKKPNLKYEHLMNVFSEENIAIVFYPVLDANKLEIHDQGVLFSEKLREWNIDIVLPVHLEINTMRMGIPYISYIYDCQHRRLPNLFSPKEQENRDWLFSRALENFPKILVNSHDAKSDCEKYFPNTQAKIFVQPFSPICKKEWLDINLNNKYGRYFIISNQFWKHKDHRTAFQAFEKFYNAGHSEFKLVCTGKMEDPRFPEYIEELKKMISTFNSRDNIILTGYVDKYEQIGLMKNAIALIQTTHFEGGPGGGSVYNAVSLGIPCIVSDIPVNKEIEDDLDVTFFKCADSNDLAEKLQKLIENIPIKPTKDELIERREYFIERYAKFLETIIADTINDFQAK